MSDYNFKSSNHLSLFVQQKKEKRRKLLEAVRKRRKEMYGRAQVDLLRLRVLTVAELGLDVHSRCSSHR